MSTLGQRNNNPLNIRFSLSNNWIGQTGEYRGFCVFDTIDYGFRAAMLLVERYILVFYCRSVRDIIYRFAPPSENKTASYVAFCVKRLLDAGFNVYSIEPYCDEFYCLISAMALFESKTEVDCDSLRKLAVHFHLMYYGSIK